MSAEIATLLREMLVELRGLRGDLRRQSNPPTIDGANNLICEIHATISDKVFTTADLIGFAAVRSSLRAAMEAVAPLDTRKLGKVLQRFDGHDCDGLHLIRVGESGAGAEWCVKRKAPQLTGNVGVKTTPIESVASTLREGVSRKRNRGGPETDHGKNIVRDQNGFP